MLNPKTNLVQKLILIRKKAIRKGMKTLSQDEILKLVSDRRKGKEMTK